jgi:hypothetical protein
LRILRQPGAPSARAGTDGPLDEFLREGIQRGSANMSEPLVSAPTMPLQISSDQLNLSDVLADLRKLERSSAALSRGETERRLAIRADKHGSNRWFGLTFAPVFEVMSLWPVLVSRT